MSTHSDLCDLDGVSASDLFKRELGLTFSDVIILPGFVGFGKHEVDITSKICKRFSLRVPFASSPMDTVTEAKMAIAMSVSNRNSTKYNQGFILSPVVVSPRQPVYDIIEIKRKYGFGGIPVTEDGNMGSRLVGLVTLRDVDFLDPNDFNTPVEKVMTPFDDLVTAFSGVTLSEANDLLRKSKKGKLPIINENRELVALIARTDLKKNQDHPLASKDSENQLIVGAAISTQERDFDRVDALVNAGVDIIVIVSILYF
ncbi:unnamed protein product [Schistosoma curassoni]|uniref:IMP dehydrogenase n=1 Tax=Schistosoma curassoni TaxID=6186 RepID=A0A183KKQ3_9TREM|nr:unnamed protein product [Schistosoma curassoni]